MLNYCQENLSVNTCYIYTHTDTDTDAHRHTRAHRHSRAQTRAHTDTHARTDARAHTDTRARTRTHTQIIMRFLGELLTIICGSLRIWGNFAEASARHHKELLRTERIDVTEKLQSVRRRLHHVTL